MRTFKRFGGEGEKGIFNFKAMGRQTQMALPEEKAKAKIKEAITRQNKRTKGKVSLPTVSIQED